MSVEKNSGAILFILASILLSSAAQVLMKVSMNELHGINLGAEISSLGIIIPVLAWGLSGLACYALSLLFWLKALSRCELSFAYPMLSLSYVLVYIIAVYWPRLGESASLLKTLGTIVIVAGVILVTWTPGKKQELQ